MSVINVSDDDYAYALDNVASGVPPEKIVYTFLQDHEGELLDMLTEYIESDVFTDFDDEFAIFADYYVDIAKDTLVDIIQP